MNLSLILNNNPIPFLSIITINYNNFIGLKDTIESVLAQEYSDYEYIIIDGGSTDLSVEIIKSYETRITYWTSEPDTGIYNAMNKGIANSTGKFTYFLNSGDVIYKSTLSELFSNDIDILHKDVIYGNIVIKNSNALVKCKIPQKILFDLPFCHQAVLSNSNLHRKYPFNESYKIAADYNFFLSLYFQGYKFYQTDINFGEIDNTGISNTAFFKTMGEYFNIIWRNSSGFYCIFNSSNYLWHKKKFIIYLLLNRLLGRLLYGKMIKAVKWTR
jgi:glycosyltransferase involved in cell wall biosynthesis